MGLWIEEKDGKKDAGPATILTLILIPIAGVFAFIPLFWYLAYRIVAPIVATLARTSTRLFATWDAAIERKRQGEPPAPLPEPPPVRLDPMRELMAERERLIAQVDAMDAPAEEK